MSGSADLLVIGTIRNKSSKDLLATFKTGIGSIDYLAMLTLGLTNASDDYLVRFIVRKKGSADLLSTFVVRHPGSVDLLSKFVIRKSASVDYLVKFLPRHSPVSADYLVTFIVYRSAGKEPADQGITKTAYTLQEETITTST